MVIDVGILSSLKGPIAESVQGAAEGIMKGLDGLFTSDDERNKAAVLISQQMNDLSANVLSHIEAQDKERTARHVADMNSDSWMSKNIRPITLAYLTAMFTLFVWQDARSPKCTPDDMGDVIDGCFAVSDQWIDLFKLLLTSVYGFYFVSRGVEKVVEQVRKIRETGGVKVR